jgi:ankyrin repeat protein
MLAVIKGNMEALDILLESPRINVNAKWPDGTNALHFAVVAEQEEIARILLDRMARQQTSEIVKIKTSSKRSTIFSRFGRRIASLVVA